MNYFEWKNQFEKSNCVLTGLVGGEIDEVAKGLSLAKLRPEPYKYMMDDDYPRNVRLTDSLVNDQSSIVASQRLRDLLVERLGEKIEALPVWIKDRR